MPTAYLPTDERDLAVQLTISNLIQAEALTAKEAVPYMSKLFKSDNTRLGVELLASGIVLANRLQYSAQENRN